MAKRIIISNSDVRLFKRCRRKWDYLSPLRKGLNLKKVTGRLWFGSGIHVALSAYYSHFNKGEHSLEVLHSEFVSWYKKETAKLEELGILGDQEAELTELKNLGYQMLDGYSHWAPKEDAKDFVKVLYNEERIEVPLLSPSGRRTCGRYTFKTDLVVEDKDKFLWLVDHKTIATGNLPSLEMDEQSVSYLYGAQKKFGIKLEGVIFNFLIKKVPSVPQVLKDGRLSKKSITTTYDVYLNAIKNHHDFETKDEKEKVEILLPYKDVLEDLQNQENPFFKREKVYKSQSEIEEIGKRLYEEYREMRNPKIRIFPNPTRDCSWDCPLKNLCVAENDGGDVEGLIKDMFESDEEEKPFILVQEEDSEGD